LSSLEWLDRAYSDSFDSALAGLEARRRTDPRFSVGDAEGVLHHLYIQEGHDLGARGLLQDAVLGATIAAHEQFIDEWRATSPANSNPDGASALEPRIRSDQ
jgi:hypothetical protein